MTMPLNSTPPANSSGPVIDEDKQTVSKSDALLIGCLVGVAVLIAVVGTLIRLRGWWIRRKEDHAKSQDIAESNWVEKLRIMSPLRQFKKSMKGEYPDMNNLTREVKIQEVLSNIHQMDYNANETGYLPPMSIETNTQCTPAVFASDRSNPKLSQNKALDLMLRADDQTKEPAGNQNSLSFRLKYTKDCRTIFITIEMLCLADYDCYLPHKAHIWIHLLPLYPEGHCIKLTEIMKSTIFINNAVQFRRVDEADLQRNTLKITVRFGRDTRNPILGEVCVPLCNFDLIDDHQHTSFHETLQPVAKLHSTRAKYLKDGLGQLCLTLKAELTSYRIKVLIRRATNLPTSRKLVGEPAHYIHVRLKKENEELKTSKTVHKSGCNPTWNTPLLLPVDGVEDFDSLSIDFVVKRTKTSHKDSVIGKVTIGSGAPLSGQTHWEDIMSQPVMEVTKWHEILPVFTFK